MTTRTALVLKNITRCEFGTMSLGLLCETFDRVEIVKSLGRLGGGSLDVYRVRAADGTVFQATSDMVQADA